MRNVAMGAALLGAALVATPSYAATDLDCMDEGYTAEQEQIFVDYYAGFTVSSLDEEGSSAAHVDAIAGRVGECAVLHDWSPDAITQAMFYRMSALLAQALEVSTPLTSEQMDRLNTTLANADHAKLREILGPGIEASMKGGDGPEMSEQDSIYLGLVVIGAGLPLDKTHSEYAGALIGARMMAEIAAENFETF